MESITDLFCSTFHALDTSSIHIHLATELLPQKATVTCKTIEVLQIIITRTTHYLLHWCTKHKLYRAFWKISTYQLVSNCTYGLYEKSVVSGHGFRHNPCPLPVHSIYMHTGVSLILIKVFWCRLYNLRSTQCAFIAWTGLYHNSALRRGMFATACKTMKNMCEWENEHGLTVYCYMKTLWI